MLNNCLTNPRYQRPMHADAHHLPRKAHRKLAFAKGSIRLLGCPAEPLLVVNLSEGGFMGVAKGSYRPGSFVEVNVPGEGVLKARIAWTRNGRIGGMFIKSRQPDSTA